MRPKSIILLALALGCGLVASIGISQVMDRQNADSGAPQVETEPILVALSNINVNDPLTAELVKLEEWPTDKIPADALRSLEEAGDQRAATKIFEGEPIRAAKLGSGQSFTLTIPPGYRSLTVRVGAETSGAGLLKPGDRVDVQLFAKKNPAYNIPDTVTRVILQDVQVAAVDHHYRRASDEDDGTIVARTVTVVVTPKQADKIALASKVGEINLIMRHPDDNVDVVHDGVSVSELFATDNADRDKERQSVEGEGGKSGLQNFLEQMKNQSNTESTELATLPPESSKLFSMVLIEGSAARELEFSEEGRLPQEKSRGMIDQGEPAAAGSQPTLLVPPVNGPTGIGGGDIQDVVEDSGLEELTELEE